MSELLSKEKEYVKLNEELNRLACKSLQHDKQHDSHSTEHLVRHQTHPKDSSGTYRNPVKRFSTISSKAAVNSHHHSKSSGSSAQNKKRAGGDGNIDNGGDRRHHHYNSIPNSSKSVRVSPKSL